MCIRKYALAFLFSTYLPALAGTVVYHVLNYHGDIVHIPAAGGPPISFLLSFALSFPTGFAVDHFGEFVVANQILSRVTTGRYISSITTQRDATFVFDVAVDAGGNYVVTDTGYHRIIRVSPDGQTITTVAGYPVSPMPHAEDAYIRIDVSGNYILAEDNYPLHMFSVTPAGVLTPIPLSGAVPSQIVGLTIDAAGNYIVTDVLKNAIDTITPAGVVTTLAQNPTGPGGMVGGIAFDAHTGNFLLTDISHNALLSVSPDGKTIDTIFSGPPLAEPDDVVVTDAIIRRDWASNARSGELVYDPSIGQEYTALAHDDGTYSYVPNLFSAHFDTLRSGEFDGNGNADLVLYDSRTGLAYIGLGKGDGTYSFQSLFWSRGYNMVESGDLNGDGKTDFALYDSSTGTMYTGISNGDGTFTYKYTLISTGYTSLRLADFNGDGRADIFLYRASDGLSHLGIGDGLGGFTFSPLFTSPGYSHVDTGDLNHDGRDDVILYNTTNGNTATGISAGTGFNFLPFVISPGYTAVKLGHFTGFEPADVILYNADTGTAYIGIGSGRGDFSAFGYMFWGLGYDYVVTHDVNYDGKTDIVLYNSATGSEYTGISTGHLGAGFTYTYQLWGRGKMILDR